MASAVNKDCRAAVNKKECRPKVLSKRQD
jgi:hypothetical protein